jgi:hypothetical protein
MFGSFLELGDSPCKVLALSDVTERTDRYLTALIQLCLASALIASNDRNANVGKDMERNDHA